MGRRWRSNKSKVDGVDYALAVFGTGCSLALLALLSTGNLSFLWEIGSRGRLGGVPGILIIVIVFAMSYYSLKRIFNSKNDE